MLRFSRCAIILVHLEKLRKYYFHSKNELTELKPHISRRNFIFVYKLHYMLTSKMADFILLTWLQTNYYITWKTSVVTC